MKKPKKKHPLLSATENDVFLKLMDQSGVKPLQKNTDSIPETKPIIVDSEPIEFEEETSWSFDSMEISENKKYSGIRPVTKTGRKKRKNLKITPEQVLDLHGETRDKAILRVESFLKKSKSQQIRIGLIITGKGLNSEEKRGVLKKTIWDWLKHYQSIQSFQFQWAPPYLGGDGAILIFFT